MDKSVWEKHKNAREICRIFKAGGSKTAKTSVIMHNFPMRQGRSLCRMYKNQYSRERGTEEMGEK